MAVTKLYRFFRDNPLRSPSWRADYVRRVVDAGKRCGIAEDQFVRAYKTFILKMRRAANVEDQLDIFPKYADLYYAHLYQHNPDPEWRWLLQACLISGQSNSEIAEYMAMSPGTVEWYEAIFFNVRERLRSRGYIVKCILSKINDRVNDPAWSFTAENKRLCYLIFAYYGGPLMLDVITSGFAPAPPPEKLEDTDAWLDLTVQRLIRSNALQAAQTLQINRYNVVSLLELHTKVMEITKSEAPLGDIEQHLQQILSSVPFQMMHKAKENLKGEVINYIDTAVEPRADETVALSVGETPKQLQDLRKMNMEGLKR